MRVKNISAKEAFEILKDNPDSILVDVRTDKEWKEVGVPDISEFGKEVIFVSWVFHPEYNWNNNFFDEISKLIADKEKNILFICRSGGRSFSAAEYLMQAGYKNCYNIEDGFEGPQNGWKASRLKWRI